MADPFAEFGGTLLEADPFAEFGGEELPEVGVSQVVEKAPSDEADPFAALGGVAEPQERESDLGEAALLGIKQGIAPFSMTKEEWNRDRTIGETLTEAVGQFASGFATGAATGAAVGSIVPGIGTVTAATVGGIAYGIYSGIGYEISRARAEDQEFSPLRAAANVVTEANPLIKGGGKIVNLARMVAQGAITREIEKSYGTEDELTLNLMAAGGGLSMIGPMITSLKPTQKSVRDLGELFTDPDHNLMGKTIQRFDAMDKTIKDSPGFRKFVAELSDNADQVQISKSFKKNWKKLSPNKQQEVYETYTFQQIQAEETAKLASEMYNKVGKRIKDPIIIGFKKVQDPKLLAKTTDDRIGTQMQKMLDDFSEAEIKTSNVMAPYIKRALTLTEESDKLGLDRKDIGRWLNGAKGAPDDATEVLTGWRNLYDDTHTHFSGHGFDIGYLDNYFNMSLLDAPDLHNAMKRQVNKFKNMAEPLGMSLKELEKELKAGGKRLGQSPKLAKKNKAKLIELKALSRGYTKGPIANFKNMDVAMDAVLDPSMKKGIGYELGVLFERQGGIASQFRDFDIGSGYLSYLNSNMKALHYSKPIAQLQANIRTLKVLGLDKSADYWTSYSKHLSGQDSGLKALIGSKMNKQRAEWDNIISDPDSPLFIKGGAKLGRFAADFSNWTTNLVYPNLLGGNVRGSVRNMHQTIVLTAPHMGGKNGYKSVARGWKALLTREDGNIEEFLKSKNIISGVEIIKDAQHELGAALRKHGTLGQLTKYSDKINHYLMWMYSKTDHLNRYITYKAGQSWAKDIIAGDTSALKNLKKVPSAHVIEIQSKGLLKDADALGDYLGRMLVSDTQFHYGKTQMHELGREGGKLFSMFTKWPSMTASEVAYALQATGSGRGKQATKNLLLKFGTPLALLHAAQKWRESDGQEKGLFTYVYGKDLRAQAPIMAAANIDIFGGPVQKTVLGGGKNVAKWLNGEYDRNDFIKSIGGTAELFSPVPGQALLNELDRWKKAHGDESWREWVDNNIPSG